MQELLDGLRFLAAAVAPDVGDMQERRAIQADLDEGRLHARQHAAHDAEVGVADQSARRTALHMQFLGSALFHHRDPRFLRGHVDEDFFLHNTGQPKRASSPLVSNTGRPTTPEWLPEICLTKSAALPWMP